MDVTARQNALRSMSRKSRVLLVSALGICTVVGAAACSSSESAVTVGGAGPAVSSTSQTTTTALGSTSVVDSTDPALVVGSDSPFGLVAPDLPGSFPMTLDAGDQVLHLQLVTRELNSAEFKMDFWHQPSSGRFRQAASSPGNERSGQSESLQVFTGERLQWYSTPSNEAFDFTYEAYQASVLEDKVDPFAMDQGEIGRSVAEIRQAVAGGMLRETGRGQVNGREIVRYEGKLGVDASTGRVVLADAATGFPLDDRMYRSNGALYSCRLADLEVVEDADLSALFSLTFPAGVKPMTDEQLPQMLEEAVGLAACLEELAKISPEVPYPLYYLGESFHGLPLEMVRPAEKTEGMRPQVGIYYRDLSHQTPSHIAIYLYDPILTPERKKPFEGWKLIRTAEVDGHVDAIYDSGSGELFYVATRGGTTIDIAGWGDAGPADEAELIEAAKSLRLFVPAP